MKIAAADHACHDWRISDIAPDFDLLDAWALPVQGKRPQFALVYDLIRRLLSQPDDDSRATRMLFALREWLGARFDWDREVNQLPIPGCRETSLRERIAEAERCPRPTNAPDGPEFRPVYHDEREFALELSNATVHAVLQVGRVDQGKDQFRAQMGVYIKTRGRLGPPYMAIIAPFRHLIVYPALMRRIQRAWPRLIAARP